MLNRIIFDFHLRRFFSSRKRLIFTALLVLAFHIEYSNAQDLVLSDLSIATEEQFFDRNSITIGSNFTVTGSGDVTLAAPTIVFKPEIVIVQGGQLLVLSNPSLVSVKPEHSITPSELVIHPNFPNPFSLETEITYDIRKAQEVKIAVYNAIGQEVKTLLSDFQNTGRHSVTWDGTSNSGGRVISGVYYCKLAAGQYNALQKMILID